MKTLRINGHRVKCFFCSKYAKHIADELDIGVCNSCFYAFMGGFYEREVIEQLKKIKCEKEGKE